MELRGLERTLEVALDALLADDGVDAVLVVALAFEFFAGSDLAGVTARAMIGEVHGARALAGGRGRPQADVDALVDAILVLARFIAEAPPDVSEAEVNPLVVGPVGRGAVAVDALIVRS